MPVPVFCCFCIPEKLVWKIFSELDETWTEPPIFPTRRRSPEETRRGAASQPHHGAARAHPQPRRGVVWGPRGPAAAALSPIYSSRRENPRYPSHYPRKVSETPPSTLAREGSEALPGTLSERGIITGGLCIAMPAFGVMCE